MEKELRLTVNGMLFELSVKPKILLVEVLRNKLGLTGTKTSCMSGTCGVCTVLLDGKAVKSCSILALQANERNVLTIEGLRGENGVLHPVQEAFIEHFAVQCGYCTPGMIMAAKALLDENPAPTEEEVKEGLQGNLCRCTGYTKIVEAVLAAKDKVRR